MNSIRKWFYRPRRDDPSLLAQFYYADEELNLVAGELDSFDGRKDPERCTALVNQLRQCQDRVLNICIEMMEELLPHERAVRDYRSKFPDDVMQESLSGQLWFGAECLAAGSSILNRESESARMRPLAKAVTKTIEKVRNLLREQNTEDARNTLKYLECKSCTATSSQRVKLRIVCLKPIPDYTEKICESLKILDRLFADFELSYVSAMVPVKSVDEYDMQQNVIVLFSDTLQRAFKIGLVDQDQIDNYDPALMFTIPRLAIVAGLVIFPDGPLNLEKDSKNLSELFRPFKTLLQKIRELLWTMSAQELATLEKCLCSLEEPDISIQNLNKSSPISHHYGPMALTTDFIDKFYTTYPSCRQLTPELSSLCPSKKMERNERKRDRYSSKSSRTRVRQERQNERFLLKLTGMEERPRARRRTRRGLSQYNYYYPFSQERRQMVSQTSHQENSGRILCNDVYSQQTSVDSRQDCEGYSYPVIQSSNSNQPLSSHRSNLSSNNRLKKINTIICACNTLPPSENRCRNSSPQLSGSTNHEALNNSRSMIRNSNYIPNAAEYEPNSYDMESSSINDHYQSSYDNTSECPYTTIPNFYSNADILPSSMGYDTSLQRTSQNIVAETLTSSITTGNVRTEDCDCDNTYDAVYSENSDLCYDSLHSPRTDESSYIETEQICLENAVDHIRSEAPVPLPRNSKAVRGSTYRKYFDQLSSDDNCDIVTPEKRYSKLMRNKDNEILTPFNSEIDEGSSGSTSPHHSGAEDDEEVALALQAAEVAASWKARERFVDSGDLIQRLFVCISGVADQLQTNYASDLRKILKSVFLMNQSEEEEQYVEIVEGKETVNVQDDLISTNESEQLSVESAEDALIVIGSADSDDRVKSPDEMDELEEESNSLDGESASIHINIGSVIVPPSIFNDHSHMQYSSMSPPPLTSRPYAIPPVDAHPSDESDNEISECFGDDQQTELNTHLETVSTRLNQVSISGGVSNPVSMSTGGPITPTMNNAVTLVASSTSPARSFQSSSPIGTLESQNYSPTSDVSRRHPIVQEPPPWIPDHLAPRCMACGAQFTVVRRRHHCRNCGKVFCGHCSRHSVPLPHFGIWKNVRVCNACFLYYVTSSADGSSALS